MSLKKKKINERFNKYKNSRMIHMNQQILEIVFFFADV